MRQLFRRFVSEDDGQDLVEYALLAAFVALASVAALDAIQASLRTAYTSWITAAQSCSQMPAPGSSSGC